MTIYDESTLSSYALDVLNTLNDKSTIKYVNEVKKWDGIDEYGPEIIIYDLYLIIDKSGESDDGIELYSYYHYHLEKYSSEEDYDRMYILEDQKYYNEYNKNIILSNT